MAFDVTIGSDTQNGTAFANIVIGSTLPNPPPGDVFNILIGADAQPASGFGIVIGTSEGGPAGGTIDIVIGNAQQPATGFDVVIGDGLVSGAVLLDVAIPSGVTAGTNMIACVVRTGDVYPSTAGWTKAVDGIGVGSFLLDVWTRIADGTEGGSTLSFFSFETQEMQGALLAVDNINLGAMVVDSITTLPYVTTATLATPAGVVRRALDTIISIWCVTGTVTITRPSGYTALDTYSSAVVAQRSFHASYIRGADVATLAAVGPASASAAVSGQGWSVVIRYSATGSNHVARVQNPILTPQTGHRRRT